MSKLFSIIVPVYNTPGTLLGDMFASLEANDLSDAEIIVIDDGSTDESTVSLCDDFASRPYCTVKHIENGGVSNARNTGIGCASGEYVLFVDADDTVSPDTLSSLRRELTEKRPDILFFDYKKCYASGSEEICYRTADKTYSNKECRELLLDALVVEKGLALCWGKAFRREFLSANGICFDKRLSLAEDADFALRCYGAAESVYYLHKCLYGYNVSSSSTVRKFDPAMPVRYAESMEQIICTVKATEDAELINRAYNFSLYHLLIIIVNNVFHKDNTASYRNKVKLLRGLKDIPCFKDALPYTDYRLFSRTRAITLFFVKHGMYFPVMLIAKIRQATVKES